MKSKFYYRLEYSETQGFHLEPPDEKPTPDFTTISDSLHEFNCREFIRIMTDDYPGLYSQYNRIKGDKMPSLQEVTERFKKYREKTN